MGAGYGGPEFLFSKTDAFPRYIRIPRTSGRIRSAVAIDSHVRPLKVQQKLGLRVLSHHKVGRHSAASQAVTSGDSVKAVQAQLGHVSEQSTHKYAHLGAGAQRRLVEALRPSRAPHEGARHVNLASTDAPKGAPRDAHGNVASTGTEEASAVRT